jgi:hypothetical protein
VGVPVAVKTQGVFELAKVSAQAWTVGAPIYWDASAAKATTVASTNTFIGHATEAAANPSAVGRVKLGPAAEPSDVQSPVVGVAAGYKVARSAAPVALDGSNPTSVAHGLTTCLSAHVQLVGSAAPGLGTSILTCVINGANIDVYAWKPTGAGDATLIASTGTETFNWVAVGT